MRGFWRVSGCSAEGRGLWRGVSSAEEGRGLWRGVREVTQPESPRRVLALRVMQARRVSDRRTTNACITSNAAAYDSSGTEVCKCTQISAPYQMDFRGFDGIGKDSAGWLGFCGFLQHILTLGFQNRPIKSVRKPLLH